MIILINGEEKATKIGLIDQMHRMRKNIFHDHLRWNVTIAGEWEIDHYDALNPLYVLSLDADNNVRGGLRLLPTTGPNMLNDTFGVLLPEAKRIESPLIWESSRFTIRTTGDRRRDFAIMSAATAELGLAMNEIGLNTGLSHIVTVYDAVMHRMLKMSNCEGEPLGPPQMIGNVLTYAVIYEIGEALEKRLKAASGIGASVLPDDYIIKQVA